jgi:hypothetical protein
MRHIARKWLESGVMIAMYEELVALVEQEEASLRG